MIKNKLLISVFSILLSIGLLITGLHNSMIVFATEENSGVAQSNNIEISQKDDGSLKLKPLGADANMTLADTFYFEENSLGKTFPGLDRVIPEPMILLTIDNPDDLKGNMELKWEGHENYGCFRIVDKGSNDGNSTKLEFSFWNGKEYYNAKEFDYTYGCKLFIIVEYKKDVNRWRVIKENADGYYEWVNNDWHAMAVTTSTNVADKEPRRLVIEFSDACEGVNFKRATMDDIVFLPTPLDTIYQSLDFGDYPIDFDEPVTIDGNEYKYGDSLDSVGVHKLIYSESGNEYSRNLVLYKLGDINCDSKNDLRDLVVLKKKLAGVKDINEAGEKGADFSLDGKITSDDLVLHKKNLLEDKETPQTPYTAEKMDELVDFTVEVESGRDIRVLQLTDTQIIESEQQRTSDRLGSAEYNTWLSTKKSTHYHKFLNYTIRKYNPDFIFITGDVIYGEFDDSGESLVEFIKFMDSFEIPWAPVFGNHDNESYKGADWQCEQFENSKYCLFRQRDLTGNGNYTVGLKQDGKYKRVFFMLDSNGCGKISEQSLANGHSQKAVGFGEDQIEWYTNLAKKMRYAVPEIKLSAAFHIQLNVFAKAFAKYGYVSGTSENLPLNFDTLEDAEDTDFGYIGRKLKDPWDTNDRVWYSLKNLGFDSIHVGHEHCNSASVVYRGVRLQYGQKSSTYDRANYLQSDGTISSAKTSTPIVGGTTVPVKYDGSLGQGELFLYDASQDNYELPEIDPEPPVEIVYTENYDFDGIDFDTTSDGSGVCASDFIVRKISDTSTVPLGFSEGVYGRANKSSSGYATFSAKFTKAVETEKLVSLKVRMYVDSYAPSSGKTPLVRILPNSSSSSMVTEATFEEMGGVYNQWCEIDIWPYIEKTKLISDGKLSNFIFAFRFYTSDTTAMCYYDDLIFGYSEAPKPDENYDFNGTDFSTVTNGSGACADDCIVKEITNTSNVPVGYSNGVYGNTNSNLKGMATVSVTFAEEIDTSELTSLKVKMYVSSFSPKPLRKDYIRIYNEEGSEILKSETFANLGGVYDEWCEIDILPLLRETTLIENNSLSGFVMTYQYYTNDTTTVCYYDSLTLSY